MTSWQEECEKAEEQLAMAAGKKHGASSSQLSFVALGILSFQNRDYTKALA